MAGFITTTELTDWAPGPFTGLNATVLQAVVDAATRAIQDYCGRAFLQATYTEILDGNQAVGRWHDRMMLDARNTPVAYNPPTDNVTVTEDGISLTVASGYSPSAGVIISGAGQQGYPCVLIRQGGSGWSPGQQNVTVTYKGGVAAADEGLKQVCRELAWRMFQQARASGLSSSVGGGKSSAFTSDIPDYLKRILDSRRVFRV